MADTISWWRGASGLRLLRTSDRLSRSADRRAGRMMAGDFFAHPARLRVPGFDEVGEVLELHAGDAPAVARTVRRWFGSAGHRRVLLAPRFRYIGIGRSTGSYRGLHATIWVVRVGR